jgi:hypothetical protein
LSTEEAGTDWVSVAISRVQTVCAAAYENAIEEAAPQVRTIAIRPAIATRKMNFDHNVHAIIPCDREGSQEMEI